MAEEAAAGHVCHGRDVVAAGTECKGRREGGGQMVRGSNDGERANSTKQKHPIASSFHVYCSRPFQPTAGLHL